MKFFIQILRFKCSSLIIKIVRLLVFVEISIVIAKVRSYYSGYYYIAEHGVPVKKGVIETQSSQTSSYRS